MRCQNYIIIPLFYPQKNDVSFWLGFFQTEPCVIGVMVCSGEETYKLVKTIIHRLNMGNSGYPLPASLIWNYNTKLGSSLSLGIAHVKKSCDGDFNIYFFDQDSRPKHPEFVIRKESEPFVFFPRSSKKEFSLTKFITRLPYEQYSGLGINKSALAIAGNPSEAFQANHGDLEYIARLISKCKIVYYSCQEFLHAASPHNRVNMYYISLIIHRPQRQFDQLKASFRLLFLRNKYHHIDLFTATLLFSSDILKLLISVLLEFPRRSSGTS
jgi:hypothetical protein